MKESGANIISGMNDLNNKLKEKEKNSNEDGELNYDNLDELDIDINEVGNNSKTNTGGFDKVIHVIQNDEGFTKNNVVKYNIKSFFRISNKLF